MKKLYGYLAVISFVLSLLVGITTPARAERTQTSIVFPMFYRLFNTEANQLLVITEPSWCSWCKELHPHLDELKKEGYVVRTYTKSEWAKEQSKPKNLPETLLPDKKGRIQYSIPMVLYVHSRTANGTHKVVKSHHGGKDKDAEYIKRYLTKR